MYGLIHDDENDPIRLSEWLQLQHHVINDKAENNHQSHAAFDNIDYYTSFNFFHLIRYLPLFLKVAELNRNKLYLRK